MINVTSKNKKIYNIVAFSGELVKYYTNFYDYSEIFFKKYRFSLKEIH